jgi:ribosomal RNA assembly protein
MIQTIRIPTERVGVLIGTKGSTKLKIEKSTGVRLSVDSEEGDVEIDLTNAKDPGTALAVANVVTAIGRGFSPQKALLLLQDEYYLEVFDIRDYVGKRQERVIRMRSRVIGSNGKTREIVEELTGAFMSVSGNTVCLIGDIMQLDVAKRAVDMILSGSEHAAVYKFLEGSRARLKVDGMGF